MNKNRYNLHQKITKSPSITIFKINYSGMKIIISKEITIYNVKIKNTKNKFVYVTYWKQKTNYKM